MIFVSAPYSHDEREVMNWRYHEICKHCASLMAQAQTAISPIIPGHILSTIAYLPRDFKFWKTYCFELLDKCTEVHVLMLPGWDQSAGVRAEIEYANSLNIPIKYIEV